MKNETQLTKEASIAIKYYCTSRVKKKHKPCKHCRYSISKVFSGNNDCIFANCPDSWKVFD